MWARTRCSTWAQKPASRPTGSGRFTAAEAAAPLWCGSQSQPRERGRLPLRVTGERMQNAAVKLLRGLNEAMCSHIRPSQIFRRLFFLSENTFIKDKRWGMDLWRWNNFRFGDKNIRTDYLLSHVEPTGGLEELEFYLMLNQLFNGWKKLINRTTHCLLSRTGDLHFLQGSTSGSLLVPFKD